LDALDAIMSRALPNQVSATKYPEGYKPIGAKGDVKAKIVIVGEAPGADEVRTGKPFSGASGKELDKMLADAGIIKWIPNAMNPLLQEPDYSGVYFTNVTLIRPKDNDIEHWVQRSDKRKTKGKKITPEHWVIHRGWYVEPHVAEDAKRLVEELKAIQPNVVIALGNTPFWALCAEGVKGKVGTWRGSTLISDVIPGLKVIPAYHPAFILRQWQHRRISVQDLRRARAASASPALPAVDWEFTIAPTYHQATDFLQGLLIRLEQGECPITLDIEGAQQRVLCLGLGVSAKQAICIPIFYKGGFWFNAEQRFILNLLLFKVLHHKNVRVIGQNIGFDTQYVVNDFLVYPRIHWDTMIAQNVLFPGTPKNLAYQASMYCSQYRYWKDDSEEFWKAKRIENWESIWFYNCEDCCRTFEVFERQQEALARRNLTKQFDFLQRRVFRLIRKAMFRGVRVDLDLKRKLLRELSFIVEYAQAKVNYLATRRLDINSPKQLVDFFYHELKIKPILNEEGNPTCDGDAVLAIGKIEPLVGPLCRWINLTRSYNTAISVCKAETEKDLRWHCSYSLGLVETYRLSSSKNPYGRGLNLMNISAGKDIKDGEDD
jgi:uracil-DNA glycosylase